LEHVLLANITFNVETPNTLKFTDLLSFWSLDVLRRSFSPLYSMSLMFFASIAWWIGGSLCVYHALGCGYMWGGFLRLSRKHRCLQIDVLQAEVPASFDRSFPWLACILAHTLYHASSSEAVLAVPSGMSLFYGNSRAAGQCIPICVASCQLLARATISSTKVYCLWQDYRIRFILACMKRTVSLVDRKGKDI